MSCGQLRRGAWIDEYYGLCAHLKHWRFDEDLHRTRMQVLAFVQGLRFSALLIYAVRKVLKQAGLTASWGLILDEQTDDFSRECDIIVHRRNQFKAWNGGDGLDEPVMDFRFIPRSDAKLVISCKSQLRSITKEMTQYARAVRELCDRVWLFAECCPPRKLDFLREQARAAGYDALWCLYSLEKDQAEEDRYLQC